MEEEENKKEQKVKNFFFSPVFYDSSATFKIHLSIHSLLLKIYYRHNHSVDVKNYVYTRVCVSLGRVNRLVVRYIAGKWQHFAYGDDDFKNNDEFVIFFKRRITNLSEYFL